MAVAYNIPAKLSLDGNLSENWKTFKEAFRIYLIASGLDEKNDSRKIAIFLNFIGEEALRVHETIKKETDTKLAEVLQTWQEYCNPKKNTLHSRFLFYSRNQKEGESVNSFHTDLKTLLMDCAFDDSDSMLRDRLVLGSNDKDIKTKLIKKGDPSLSDVVTTLRAAELAGTQVREIISQSTTDVSTVDSVKTSYQPEQETCKKCGYKHRTPDYCPASNKTCAKCQGRNHFAKVCRSKQSKYQPERPSKKQPKKVDEACMNSSDEDSEEYFCGSVTHEAPPEVTRSQAWMQTATLEDRMQVNFKLDPGADINILPVPLYSQLKELAPLTLRWSPSRVQSWNGSQTQVKGTVILKIKIGNRASEEKFYVAGNEQSIPILSRDTCTKFQLVKRLSVDEIISNESKDPQSILNSQLLKEKEAIISEFKDRFQGVGRINKEYSIKLKPNSLPSSYPPHRVPLKVRPKLEEELNRLLSLGIISKVDNPNSWVNRLVTVEKPNGDLRICLDPKDLNEAIVKEYCLIPTLDDFSCKLKSAKIFCVLDLKDSFWYIPLDEASSNLCTFSTMFGTYKFLRLPFGVNVASEVCQKCNNEIFGGIENVLICIDDILIYDTSKEKAKQTLLKILKTAREHDIRFNVKKFQYMVERVHYWGQVFSNGTVQPDDESVQAILDYDMPSSKKDLQRFLGMINYLRAYIPNVAEITAPLRELLKKEVIFTWLNVHSETVNKLKQIIINHPVLQTFDPDKQIVIQADASKNGTGCVLMQQGKPVSYASKALSSTEIRYSQIEKEFLSVLYACKRFHSFIYGQKIIVHTDHKPIVKVMKKDIIRIPSIRLQRIRLKLTIYDMDVRFLQGSKMHIADALSRACSTRSPHIDTDPSLNEIVHSLNVSDDLRIQLQNESDKDPALKISISLKILIINGWPSSETKVPIPLKLFYQYRNVLSIEESLIFLDNRLVVPESMRKTILEKLHESHVGITKLGQNTFSTGQK
nr:PREDICTED: uncharacterized protein K02A2.6-like [Bemisia tabaci]